MRWLKARAGLIVVVMALGVCARAGAADGDPDPTFSGDGLASTSWPYSISAVSLAVGADGSAFHASTEAIDTDDGVDLDFAIAKFRPNGTLDTTFGFQGRRTVGFDVVPAGDDVLLAAFPMADGGLLLAGHVAIDPETFTYAAPGVLKLTAAGNVDETFGDGGRVVMATPHYAGGDDHVRWRAVARQSDGKLVFAGDCSDCEGEHRVVVVRLNASGALDSSFGVQGWFDTVTAIQLGAVAIDAHGRIVLGGTSSDRPWFARLDAGGGLDVTFGTGGIAWWQAIPTFANQWRALGMTLQRDGAILLALGNGAGALVRATANGDPDASFGDNGFRGLQREISTDVAAVAVGSDRRIVFAGMIHHTGGGRDHYVGRLLPDGNLDDDFDGNGVLSFDAVAGEDDYGIAIAIVGGRPLIAGLGGADLETATLIRLSNDRIFTDDFAM